MRRWTPLVVGAAALACATPPAAECPAAPHSTPPSSPAPSASSAPAAGAPVTEAPLTASLLALPLAWEQDFYAGDVRAAASGVDLVLVPRFMGATIEGSRAARLDPAGVSSWERAFPGIGAADLAVAPGGRAIAVAVSALDWPKTADAYGSSRLVWLDDNGVTTWTAPKGVELTSVAAPSDGEVLFSASFRGSVQLSPSITVEADSEGAWLVASLEGGAVRWASVRDVPLSLTATAAGSPYAIVAPDGAEGRARWIERLGPRGAKTWKVELDGPCGYRDAAVGPGGHLFVTTQASCAPPDWRVDTKTSATVEAGCRLTELSPEDGRALRSAPVPGCWVRADDDGVAVADDEESGALTITLLDATLAPLRQVFAHAPTCPGTGGGLSDFVLAARSVYVVGACSGDRIGTMFNSPYSRAYAMSTTYVARYARP